MRKEAGLLNPMTGEYMELDIYLPSLSLAFEFQEKHHYMSSDYTYQPLSYFTSRDQVKQRLAQAKGITLITVPYWWDGKEER